MRKTINLAVLLALSLALGSRAHANPKIYLYTEKADFLTAAAQVGQINLETFTNLPAGANSLLPNSLTLPQQYGGAALTVTAANGPLYDAVLSSEEWISTDHVRTPFTLTFSGPTYAVGGDFFLAGPGNEAFSQYMFDVTATLADNTELVVHFNDVDHAASVFTGFAGFTSTDQEIISVTLSNIESGWGGIDNVYTAATPEPTTLLLLGSGLLAAARLARKRPRT